MEMRCENDTCIFSSFPQKININVKKAYIKKLFIKFYVIIIDMDAKLLYSKCQSITFLNFVQFNIERRVQWGIRMEAAMEPVFAIRKKSVCFSMGEAGFFCFLGRLRERGEWR
ncbi:hypothetical protein HMSSN036_75570 [Paenibacillus macerans]|nr:hypothetical protein HMSSN036_75570 [Paenibacillus macerans]